MRKLRAAICSTLEQLGNGIFMLMALPKLRRSGSPYTIHPAGSGHHCSSDHPGNLTAIQYTTAAAARLVIGGMIGEPTLVLVSAAPVAPVAVGPLGVEVVELCMSPKLAVNEVAESIAVG